MGEIFAVIIAVEEYHDPFLNPVLFAEADAVAVSGALVDIGCPESNQTRLINSAATATAIRSDVKTVLGNLSSTDQAFIFFAGHGFSDSHHNYLAAHDTRTKDLEATSVRLQQLMGFAKASKSKKIVFFLDACHTGITVEDTMRSVVVGIDEVKDEEFCAGFASCRADQKSYSSRRLGHGIWTYHLIEALSGRAKRALDGFSITAAKLQAYLADEVPRTVRVDFVKPPVQTPRFFGSFETLGAIVDLSGVLAKRKLESAASALSLKQVAFVLTSERSIQTLRGFEKKKGHFVPTDVSQAANSFVCKVASEELTDHMQEKFGQIRNKMGIKSRDITVGVTPGAASIRTPSFDYNVTVGQSSDEPDSALWRYELVNVIDAAVLDSREFNEVFKGTFDTVEFTFKGGSPNIRTLVGELEDAGCSVDCPMDYGCCSFFLDDIGATIQITAGAVNFVFSRPQLPRALAAGFQSARAQLSTQTAMGLLLSS